MTCSTCHGEGFVRTNQWAFGPDCPDCNSEPTIHVAYAYERRNRCFRARAYVGRRAKPLHSITVGIGDTSEEAMGQAIAYIYQMHDRDSVVRPAKITHYGKVTGAVLDTLVF